MIKALVGPNLIVNRIRAAEARLSDKMAVAVIEPTVCGQVFDGELDISVPFKKQRQARDWCEAHKRLLLEAWREWRQAASVSLVIDIYGYMMYNDKVLGIVKNQKDVYDIITIGTSLHMPMALKLP